MLSSDNKDTFITLVRLGIGHRGGVLPECIEWNDIEALAAEQGLSAVLVDGVEKLPWEQRPPKLLLLRWIGEVLQEYEHRYLAYRRTIAEMAAFYNSHGFKMMVLKGFACSLNWPKPEHRPCGDIDIWLFGRQQAGDKEMFEEFKKFEGFNIDNSHHHHTVFQWQGFTVENQYDFGNVYHHKSSRKLEAIFKELADDNLPLFDYCFQPSANLHALFLLKNSMTDFAAFYVTLRQVLNWGFFVKAHGNEVDWKWLEGILEEYHMLDFFNALNAICVEDLGFCLVESLESRVESQLKSVEFRELKDRILHDILELEFSRSAPKRLVPRLLYMFRRWKGNAWKHRLCYNESLWSAFWSGIWGHLLKPKSI